MSTHSENDAFVMSRLEPAPRTFDPTTVLGPEMNKTLFILWSKAPVGGFNKEMVAVLEKNAKVMAKLEAMGLLPAYFAYALELAFQRGFKPGN